MNIREDIITDIRTTLNLLSKYSDKNKMDISSVVASVIDSTAGKNLIDLFVIREYVKDRTNSILAADIENENEQMQEDTDNLDFDSGDLGDMPDGPDMPEDDGEGEEDPEAAGKGGADNAEAKEVADRKQQLLDSAEGYIQAIDLGINNIQNGDVDLSLVGQLIDLKTLIQESVDKVNEADNSENPDVSTLNVLEAVLNNLEPQSDTDPENQEQEITHTDENGEEVKGDIEKDEEGNIVENDSSIESIIRSVSAGSVEASTQITDLVRKLNDIVDNPDDYLNPNPDADLTEDTPEDEESYESEGEKSDGEEDSEGSEESEETEETEDSEESEEKEDKGPSAADEFVQKVASKDKKAATSSKRKVKGKAISSATYDFDANSDTFGEELDSEDIDDIFALTSDDISAIKASRFDNKSGLMADDESIEEDEGTDDFGDDNQEEFGDDEPSDDENLDFGEDEEMSEEGTESEDSAFGDDEMEEGEENPDFGDDEGLSDDEFAEDDFASEEAGDSTTPYVDEVEDIDFESADIPEKYEDPEEVEAEKEESDNFKQDVSEIRDSFASKLDELEAKYSGESEGEDEKADDSLESEDGLLSTDASLGDGDPILGSDTALHMEDPYYKDNRKDTALSKADKATKTPNGGKEPFDKFEIKSKKGSTPIVGNGLDDEEQISKKKKPKISTIVDDTPKPEVASNMTMNLRNGLESSAKTRSVFANRFNRKKSRKRR